MLYLEVYLVYGGVF